MPARELPDDLAALLERARAVETAAATSSQRQNAATATTRLLLACLDAGWRLFELQAAAGLKRSTAQRRVTNARTRGLEPAAVVVPLPPARRRKRSDVWRTPVEQREWLSVQEAADFAGVNVSTIARWRRAGVLPNTTWTSSVQALYLRADIIRVAVQPRWRNGGVRLDHVRAMIVADQEVLPIARPHQ